MKKQEFLVLIGELTANCAPVTMEVAKDHALILKCPPRVLRAVIDATGRDAWRVSIVSGGARVSFAPVQDGDVSSD